MKIRLDADFYAPKLRALDTQLEGATFSPVKLGDLCDFMAGGATPLRQDESQYAESGIKFLRIQNVTEQGLDFEDVKFISLETHEELLERSQLQRGDVLMTITGRIGTAATVREVDLPANINQHIVLLRLDQTQITPNFLTVFLNSELGVQLTNRSVSGTTRLALDYGAVRAIPIPLPPLSIQQKLTSQLETARSQRNAHLEQADALLSGLDAWLLEQLGLTPPAPDTRSSFAVTLGDLSADKRISPDYYHPERILAIRRQAQNTDLRSERLADIADFVREQKIIGDEFYLGLANVAPNTGELVEATGEVEGAVFHFQRDDVLFARLRPYLNKVHRAERDGVCSTEFYVLRLHSCQPDDEVLPDYLAVILRSSLTLAQTRHMMTGNTHPRLANEDVTNLVVPIPKREVQQTIAAEVTRRRDQARRLRDEAESAWESAKARFEAQLLGGETP